MSRRVLITGARAAAALDLARDFAAAGWEAHLADCVPARMASWSRAPARVHRYPAPRYQSAAFRERIVELVETLGIDLVVPTCEEVFHLAAPAVQGLLEARLFASPLSTLRRLHDKLAFARHCAAFGLPVPVSRPIDSARELAGFAATSRDWVFKPRFGRFGDSTRVAPGPEELIAITPGPDAPWMAQQRIIGEETCFYAVAHRGELVAFAAYGSEWRLQGGASYAFDPLTSQRERRLRDIAARLARSAEIHGQFACDVMFDTAGSPFLLECNPRATSGVHLLVGAGHLAPAMADGVPAPGAPPSAACYLGPAMLLLGLPRALRDAKARQWWRCLASGHDAISRPGDRRPFLGALVDAAAFTLAGFKRSISTNAATTHDLEWNGEELP
ncbi:ATP-grasp domain-containing protein [Modicisalibacter coralii]|uniref:ATP-grasp domain-containing protein n=1 Tax=Modicisalibacter coralii TaxID=2304602 RepID=UPI001396B67E|nr:ATP-grasp domain-containing protein [Halomonas coralii]